MRRFPTPALLFFCLTVLGWTLVAGASSDYAADRGRGITPVRTDSLPNPLGEGFFEPDELDLPPGVERGLQAVVRVAPEIRFELTIYTKPKKTALARKKLSERKKFLEGGGVLWKTPIDTTTLGKLCGNPVAQVQPGFAEICAVDWRATCSEFTCERTTRQLSGSGTGVVVGSHPEHGLLIATPYHIARESIERHERTGGVRKIQPATAPDVTVGIDTNGPTQTGGYESVETVTLLAHASADEWQQGEDWALLAIPDRYAKYVRPAAIAASRPAAGDTLWSAGFPYRTVRKSAPQVGYPNADNELRVSVGHTVNEDTLEADAVHETDIVNTLDAVNGSSGSPVFNRGGELVGLVRHGYCPRSGGELNMAIARYCGVALITPISLWSPYLDR